MEYEGISGSGLYREHLGRYPESDNQEIIYNEHKNIRNERMNHSLTLQMQKVFVVALPRDAYTPSQGFSSLEVPDIPGMESPRHN